MQFSTIMTTLFLAAATSVAAKKHSELHCITASGSGQFIVGLPNNDVTRKTCPGFCSDCVLSNSGTTITCKSPGKLMEGGDFSDACIKNGGSGSEQGVALTCESVLVGSCRR